MQEGKYYKIDNGAKQAFRKKNQEKKTSMLTNTFDTQDRVVVSESSYYKGLDLRSFCIYSSRSTLGYQVSVPPGIRVPSGKFS